MNCLNRLAQNGDDIQIFQEVFIQSANFTKPNFPIKLIPKWWELAQKWEPFGDQETEVMTVRFILQTSSARK